MRASIELIALCLAMFAGGALIVVFGLLMVAFWNPPFTDDSNDDQVETPMPQRQPDEPRQPEPCP